MAKAPLLIELSEAHEAYVKEVAVKAGKKPSEIVAECVEAVASGTNALKIGPAVAAGGEAGGGGGNELLLFKAWLGNQFHNAIGRSLFGALDAYFKEENLPKDTPQG